MGGPTFSFFYDSFSAAEERRLRELIARLGDGYADRGGSLEFSISPNKVRRVLSRGGRTKERRSLIGLTLNQPSALIGSMAPTERTLFADKAGFLPNVELSAWIATKDPIDWDTLNFLGESIANEFGGWAISTRRESVPSGVTAVEIAYKDYAAYFGPSASDRAYVEQYDAHVPQSRYWVVDVRGSPWGWAQK